VEAHRWGHSLHVTSRAYLYPLDPPLTHHEFLHRLRGPQELLVLTQSDQSPLALDRKFPRMLQGQCCYNRPRRELVVYHVAIPRTRLPNP
jgi:hypothetical protein